MVNTEFVNTFFQWIKLEIYIPTNISIKPEEFTMPNPWDREKIPTNNESSYMLQQQKWQQ